MPRSKLVMLAAGVSALLGPELDLARAQNADGHGANMQMAQEGSQRRSRRSGADRPTERDAPEAPAVKATPPASSIAPADLLRRDAGPSHEAAMTSTGAAQEVSAMQTVCLKALAPIRASIDVSEPIRNGNCGTLGSVIVRSVGGVDPVAVSPASPLTCPMVVSLHDWVETGLQPIARALLGVPIASLTGVVTYQCRDRVGGTAGLRSEHALANAVDITAFVTTDGRTVAVKDHWGTTARDGSPPATPKLEVPPEPKAKGGGKSRNTPKPEIPAEDAQSFLKAVHRVACRHFTTVLGPEANEAHRDHFHFDLAQRRSGHKLCE